MKHIEKIVWMIGSYHTFNLPHVFFKEDYSDEQWKALEQYLNHTINIFSWGDYINPNIVDGSRWRLEIFLTNGEVFVSSGSNAYPDNFDAFKKYIETFKTSTKVS